MVVNSKITTPVEDETSDDEASWDSIISEPRGVWYPDSAAEEKLTEEETKFLEDWDKLERDLLQRMNRMKELTRNMNERFREQVVRRELQAATRKRQEFVKSHASITTPCSNKELLETIKTQDSQNEITKSSNVRWGEKVTDFFVFEFHTTVRAIVGLILHSVAMCGCSFIVDIMIQRSTTFLANRFGLHFLMNKPVYSSAAIFFVGALITRCSGYLYWWLNNRDYDCIKFDYHNRLRLRFPGAVILHSARRNLILRLVVYLIGYNTCYQMAETMYGIISNEIYTSESVLHNLPSTVAKYDPYFNDDTFVCLRSCDEERQAIKTVELGLLEDDFSFTQTYLSAHAHGAYWSYWLTKFDAFGAQGSNITDPSWFEELAVAILLVSVCLLVLRLYGFEFWKTIVV